MRTSRKFIEWGPEEVVDISFDVYELYKGKNWYQDDFIPEIGIVRLGRKDEQYMCYRDSVIRTAIVKDVEIRMI